jgi:hypothetical protein
LISLLPWRLGTSPGRPCYILSRISCTTVYLADDARAKWYTLVNDSTGMWGVVD